MQGECMIQGERVRLHAGSVCKYADAKCFVVGYDAAEKKWRVKLANGRMEIVSESSLVFWYSVMASSLARLTQYQELGFESAQGSCGRGLVAAHGSESDAEEACKAEAGKTVTVCYQDVSVLC